MHTCESDLFRSSVITVTLFILVKSQNPCHFRERKSHLVVVIKNRLSFQHIIPACYGNWRMVVVFQAHKELVKERLSRSSQGTLAVANVAKPGQAFWPHHLWSESQMCKFAQSRVSTGTHLLDCSGLAAGGINAEVFQAWHLSQSQ